MVGPAADKIVINHSITENAVKQGTIGIATGSVEGALAVLHITTIIVNTTEITNKKIIFNHAVSYLRNDPLHLLPLNFLSKKWSTSFASVEPKSEFSLLDYGTSDHFVWDCKVFETSERLNITNLHTCAGDRNDRRARPSWIPQGYNYIETLIQTRSRFNGYLILYSKLTPDFKVEFDYDENATSYTLTDQKSGSLALRNTEQGGLYPFPSPVSLPSFALQSSQIPKIFESWHAKLGHIWKKRILVACSIVIDVPNFKKSILKQFQCAICIESKSKRISIEKPMLWSTFPLELTRTWLESYVLLRSVEPMTLSFFLITLPMGAVDFNRMKL